MLCSVGLRSIRAAARIRRVCLRKSNCVKIIPMHMMIREIVDYKCRWIQVKSEQLSHVIDTSMLLTNTYNIYIFMLLIVFYRVN